MVWARYVACESCCSGVRFWICGVGFIGISVLCCAVVGMRVLRFCGVCFYDLLLVLELFYGGGGCFLLFFDFCFLVVIGFLRFYVVGCDESWVRLRVSLWIVLGILGVGGLNFYVWGCIWYLR